MSRQSWQSAMRTVLKPSSGTPTRTWMTVTASLPHWHTSRLRERWLDRLRLPVRHSLQIVSVPETYNLPQIWQAGA
jgi:hypothetical protein